MMVVRGTLPENTLQTHAATVVFVLPADRCAWTQVANARGGYDITNARLMFGAVEGGQIAAPISNPELGYIGKSGRFVPISA